MAPLQLIRFTPIKQLLPSRLCIWKPLPGLAETNCAGARPHGVPSTLGLGGWLRTVCFSHCLQSHSPLPTPACYFIQKLELYPVVTDALSTVFPLIRLSVFNEKRTKPVFRDQSLLLDG